MELPFKFLFSSFLIGLFYLPTTAATQPNKQTITIQLNAGAPSRAAFFPLFKQFEEEFNISVTPLRFIYDHQLFDSLQDNKIDISFGQNSERLKNLIELGYVEPITDIWQQNNYDSNFLPGIVNWLSSDHHVYGMPYTYYTWGIFAKQRIAQQFGQFPARFEDFVNYCIKVKQAGYDVFPFSQTQQWLNVGWFEYFLIRSQGIEFYHQVINGNISYRSSEMLSLFKQWKIMIDNQLFSPNYQQLNWEETVPYLLRDKLAFIFMSNDLIRKVYRQAHRDELEMQPFPKLNNIKQIESGPASILFITKSSNNKPAAKKFIEFIARPENQSFLAEKLASIPTNIHAQVSHNPFAHKAQKILSTASNITPFFDRATPVDFDKPSAHIITQFMLDGDSEKATKALEALRLSIYQKRKPQKILSQLFNVTTAKHSEPSTK